jgi:Na+/melibiose symporter-like transporter
MLRCTTRDERYLRAAAADLAIAGLGRGGINYVPWNTYTYIADVDEVITGQRREGIFAAL